MAKAYKEVVWLASYPKSGNTWVRLFLDAYFMGEVDINEIVSSVADDNAARHALGAGLDKDYDVRRLPIDIQWMTRPMALLRMVMAYQLNRKETGLDVPLFVKTHNANLITNGIEALPEQITKSTICIVRDPRDVLPSFARHMGVDLDTATDYMTDKYRTLQAGPNDPKVSDFISSWVMNVRSYMESDDHNILIIKYEDMREDPVKEFSRILEHAGVKPDDERVKQALEVCDIAKLREQEEKKGFGESSPHAKNQFFGEGKTGGWKRKLTPAQRRRIEKVCGPLMKRLGYLDKVRRIA